MILRTFDSFNVKDSQVNPGFADLSEWPYKDIFQALPNELYGFVLCNPIKFFELLKVSKMLSPKLLSTLSATWQAKLVLKKY